MTGETTEAVSDNTSPKLSEALGRLRERQTQANGVTDRAAGLLRAATQASALAEEAAREASNSRHEKERALRDALDQSFEMYEASELDEATFLQTYTELVVGFGEPEQVADFGTIIEFYNQLQPGEFIMDKRLVVRRIVKSDELPTVKLSHIEVPSGGLGRSRALKLSVLVDQGEGASPVYQKVAPPAFAEQVMDNEATTAIGRDSIERLIVDEFESGRVARIEMHGLRERERRLEALDAIGSDRTAEFIAEGCEMAYNFLVNRRVTPAWHTIEKIKFLQRYDKEKLSEVYTKHATIFAYENAILPESMLFATDFVRAYLEATHPGIDDMTDLERNDLVLQKIAALHARGKEILTAPMLSDGPET